MNVTQRLKELMDQRGWSIYRMSKEADLSWSTVRNIIKRGTDPTIGTLEICCNALGITLSQFFDIENERGLTAEQQRLIEMWSMLDEKDRAAVMALLESLSRK